MKHQQILNWLESEKKKDDLQEKIYKKKIIDEVKNIQKNQMFQTSKKVTLWERIRKIILGI